MDDGRPRLIVDANVFVHGFVNPGAHRIRMALTEWGMADVVFHVPGLWRYEVTNALYRNVKSGATSIERGEQALAKILALPVHYHDDPELNVEATLIARRLNAGAAYDAHYLALAERLEVPFYTSDAKLYTPAHRMFSDIHHISIE